MTNLLDDPIVRGLVFNSRDVSEHIDLREQLSHQALHDSLTGLPNRTLLAERIGHAREGAGRRPGLDAVLFIDLNDFKVINDTLGHATGDLVLQELARRLEASVRSADTAARFGGDEFVVFLESIGAPDEALDVANRITSALEVPVLINGEEIHLTASIGIAVERSRDQRGDDLLRDADVAMYAAKSAGRSRAVFEPLMHESLVSRLELETDLRAAVQADEFVLFYQPVVDLRAENVVGVEALIRWRHPTRGLLPPSAFLPVAEETGLIVPVGAWTLREACRQKRAWSAQGVELSVAVNISARQLEDDGIVALVARTLDDFGIEPHSLVLEVTESLMLNQATATMSALGGLNALGVPIAIDDFGTGYSSLSYLQRLPVSILKVDKTFVDGISSQEGAALVETIIRLAETLNLDTIAEGVETADQAQALRALECTQAQGYVFAKPMEASRIPDFVMTSGIPRFSRT